MGWSRIIQQSNRLVILGEKCAAAIAKCLAKDKSGHYIHIHINTTLIPTHPSPGQQEWLILTQPSYQPETLNICQLLPSCSSINAQAHNVHAHTPAHTLTHTHTHMHRRTQTHRRTHAQTCVEVYIGGLTHHWQANPLFQITSTWWASHVVSDCQILSNLQWYVQAEWAQTVSEY